MNRTTFFDSVDELVEHLYFTFDRPSNMRIHKSLYLLFGFYAGFYAYEINCFNDFPKRLFEGSFEAWPFGVVMPDVQNKIKENYYRAKEYQFSDSDVDIEVKKFIDDMVNQLSEMSDFLLAHRTKDDNCWKKAYKKSVKIPLEDIETDYRERFLK